MLKLHDFCNRAEPAPVEAEAAEVATTEPVAEEAPKTRRRPRARKAEAAPVTVEAAPEAEVVPEAVEPAEVAATPKRTRRKKADVAATDAEVVEAAVPAPKRTRARKAAALTETAAESVASGDIDPAVAETAVPADGAEPSAEDGEPRRGWWQRTFGA